MNQLIAGLIALWLVLGTTTHVHALPIFIALAGTIVGAGSLAATIVGSILATVVGMGLSYLAQRLLTKRPDQNVGGTTGRLQMGGVVPRSFPFGDKAIVSHSAAYANSFGQDGKTPNAYYVMDLPLADLPVGGGNNCLAELWVNGSKVTWNPGATPGVDGIAIPEFNKDGKDHLWIRVYDGTQTTADARLVSLFGGDPDRPYDAGRIGTGMVKAVVTFRLNRELFGGVPSFKFVVRGVPLYDLREDDTAGGEGDQRWNSPETWNAAPENNGVVLYNVLRGIRYAGEWFFGGQTVSGSQLPVSAWAAAMNEADIPTEKADGQFEPQFACSGEIRLDMEPAQVIKDLLMGCNGRLAEVGGVYKPHFGAAGSAVMSISDDDILITEGQTYEPFKSMSEQVNAVTAKYIEPGEGWTAKDAPALYDADLEAEDGGRRQSVDVAYDYVVSGTQVQRLMASALAEARRERRHSVQLPPDAYPLEPNDFIVWSSERNGYVNKLFRIDAVQDLANGNVALNLTEVDPSDYDWDADTDEQPIVISPTPLVFAPSQGIAGADIEGVTVQGQGSRAKAGARLLWNGTDQDDVRAVAFQIRLNGETEIVYQGETTEASVAEGESIVTANLLGDTDYEGRLKFVPFSGRATEWSDWIDFTTPDVRVSTSELEDRLLDVQARFDARIRDFEGRLDQVGGAIASIEAVTTEQDQMLVERARRISASLGGAKASITLTEVVIATLINAFAALGIDVEAALGTGSAAGFWRIIAEVTEDDELAALLFGASTTRDGVSADAAFRMIVALGQSIIQLKASRTEFLDDADDAFAVFDGATRTLYAERIASGTTRKHVRLVRSTGSGLQALGVGNVVAGTANGWREVSIGSINVRENAAALSGAPPGAGLIEANFRLAARGNGTVSVGKIDNSQPVYLWLEFGIIARRTGYTDVLLNDPPVQLPLVLFQFASSGDWSADAPLAVDTSLVPLDAGTWDFYLGWRLRGQNNATVADNTRQATISGHVIVSADLC